MSQSQMHSTGRGGAGNIGADNNVYVDGDIVREGVPGVSDKPEYSAGRGGQGNVVHVPGQTPDASTEVVPESATRAPGHDYDNFHTGRGGEGNVHKEKYGGHSHALPPKSREGTPDDASGKKPGLVEKAKHVIGLDKEKK